MSVHYALHVSRIHDVVWEQKFHNKVPDLYVKVKIGDVKDSTRQTRVIKRNISPHWDETLTLSSREGSTNLNIQIRHKSSWSSDPCVGYLDITLADLLKECADGEAQLKLSPPHGKGTTSSVGVLHLRLEVISATASVEKNVKAATQDIEQGGPMRSADAGDSAAIKSADQITGMSAQGELYEAMGNLVAKLDILVGIFDEVSKVHPYLSGAWYITSALFKAVSRQFQTDKKLIELVRAMESTFEFASHAQSLPETAQYLERTIIELLKQITECCLFVRQYTTHGFARRMVDLDNRKKIDEFLQSLISLREALNTGHIIYTAFVSARMSNKVESLFLQQKLNPIKSNVFGRPTCLPGTRVEIQKEINAWLLSETSQNILWLKGVAGSGKSTVSTTIAEYFRDISRLGMFLFFERGKSEPYSVIPTIAHALASFDESIAAHVIAAVEKDNDIASASAKMQFEKLLLGPLIAAGAGQGPVVIILDGLDECGTPHAREDLIRLLKEDFTKLPPHFRFILTSRPENDIVEALSSRPSSVHEIELDYTSDASRNDVLLYIKYKMRETIKRVKVPDDWPWDENMELLGKVAGGLFIWAFMAVKLVSSSDNPFRKLEKLISDSQSLVRFGLSDLYATVLRSSGIDWDDDDSKARSVQVLSLLLFSKVSFSGETIDGILGFPPTEPSDLILSRLQCLLAYTPGQPVRLFHTSFSDYLLSPGCKNEPWYIDEPFQKRFLASRCFGVMESGLRFNICDIETSFIRNDNISGLDTRVKANIPRHLEYACLYWAQHLSDVAYNPELFDMLSNFSHRHLLCWFEVLGLLKWFATIANQALEIASLWAKCNKGMSLFLKDAARLCRIFAPCITRSVAHAYVSMLSIMKDESVVAAHYSKHMAYMPSVERIGTKVPSALIRVFHGHTGSVTSVNFSPDGKRVVSCSKDRTVRIWDAESGEVLVGPLEGHTGHIRSVNFSQDGKYIVSGSDDKTVRIWDAESGKVVIATLKGHADSIRSVNFSPYGNHIACGSGNNTIIILNAKSGETETILGPLEGHTGIIRSINFSPNGKTIVSSSDRTIVVWDSENGDVVLGPLRGHTGCVTSVNFSLDGERIVSASEDKTIIVWDAKSGEAVLGPLKAHGDLISSAKFSPDGKYIISGSRDKTIIIWNAESGEVVLGPLAGHTDWIRSVDISSDGKHIISGSDDTTIRVWDAESGQVAYTLRGHALRITSVDFSPDGKRVVSGSHDKTIRIWDAESGDIVLGPLERHKGWVTSVKFSPDGKRIVSGSEDKTIIVWDSENGAVAIGPLERHEGGISSIDFSSDGKLIASGSFDKTIIVWDSGSGNIVIGPLEGHSDNVISVKFALDSKLIVSGSKDQTIIVWNVESGKVVLGPLEGHEGWVRTARFSPDGKRIISGSSDGTIRVLDVESGRLVLGPIEGHTGHVISVDFSPDGDRIVSGSSDNTIRVWGSESGEVVLGPLEGHAGWIRSVKFSPDGKRIASGSDDNTVRVWDVQSKYTSSMMFEDRPVDASSMGRNREIHWTLSEDGWVIDEQGNLLLWVPYDLHNTLWRARNTAIFSCAFYTKINFTNASLGMHWIECFKPFFSIASHMKT